MLKLSKSGVFNPFKHRRLFCSYKLDKYIYQLNFFSHMYSGSTFLPLSLLADTRHKRINNRYEYYILGLKDGIQNIDTRTIQKNLE